MACLVRYSTYSTYSKDPGEERGCSVACLVRAAPGMEARPRHLPGIGARTKVGILPRKKNKVLPWGEDCSTLFLFCPAEASIPSAPHSCRATCPASEPAPRSGFFPGRNCRLSRQFRRTCPAEPRQPDYEAVSDYAGHWACF